METTLQVYDRHGTWLGALPWSSLSRTVVRNAAGALTAQVPRNLIQAGLVEDGLRFLRVAEGGVESPDWYVLDDDGDDDADAGGPVRAVSIGGTGVVQVLEWANVYSWEYVPPGSPPGEDPVRAAAIRDGEQRVNEYARLMADRLMYAKNLREQSAPAEQVTQADLQARDARNQWLVARQDLDVILADVPPAGAVLNLDPTYGFAEATPGHILKTLIDAAKARGCFPYLTYSFTGDEDSAGTPWPYSYARTYEIGTSLLKVLEQMVEDGWVDFDMVGLRLDLYVADTAMALDKPDTILQLGESVRQAPRKRTRKAARSVLLANGAEGAAVELRDPEALAKWGRREGYEGRGGISDVGTLTAATQVSLQRATSSSESFTLEVTPAAGIPDLPRPGGFIRYDRRRLSPTQLEPLRVQSIAWDYGTDPKLSVEVADLWVDGDIKRGRQVDAILNGSSANERVPQREPGDDKVPPGPVVGLAVVSTAYLDGTGHEQAQVTATWTEVTADADGTAINDLLGYDIEWRQEVAGYAVHRIRTAVVTMQQWSGLVSNATVDIRIRAVDRYQNGGVWTAWETFDTGRDETPPPKPSVPEAGNYLGLFRVYWDGGFVGDAARVADFSHVEVHISPLDGFAVDGGTLAGTLATAGALFRELPYGVEHFTRLVGVDFSGNKSEPTAQAAATPGQILGPDIFERAVGEQHIAYAAIRTAHIDDLAVNNAKIGDVEVGKLIAGTMTADVIMGGRISTADPGPSGTAQRVELNSLGIYRWDGVAAEPVVAIDNGGALITGLYRTARTGRRIEMGVSGSYGSIQFVAADGGVQTISSSTWAQDDGNVVETLALRSGTQSLIQATEDNTVSLWGWEQSIHYRDTWFVNRGDSVLVNNQRTKLNLDSGDNFRVTVDGDIVLGAKSDLLLDATEYRFDFAWADGWSQLKPGNAQSSPQLTFYNGLGYGALLKFYTAGGADPQRFEVRWGGDNGWYAVWAQAFVVQSDAAGKDEIRAADRKSLLSEVRGTPVSTYRRPVAQPAGDRRGRAAAPRGPVERGLIAQEAPEQIVAGRNSEGELTIDLYQMVSTVWGAAGELADLVDAQGRELAELRTLVGAAGGGPPARRGRHATGGDDTAR